MTTLPRAASGGVLSRLGLDRPEVRAWAMYDWAVSAVQTTIMVAVFPIYFKKVAAAGLPDAVATGYVATANSVALVLIAVLSPVLGAWADFTGKRKRFLAAFMALGAGATALMFFVRQGDLWLGYWLFVASLLGASGSFVFYEALLPHVAHGEAEIDRVSAAGYGLGYVGGGVLLALNLAWILKPGLFGLPAGAGLGPDAATLPTRLALLSVAVWWVLFSLPLFRRVPEPPRAIEPGEARRGSPVRAAFGRLARTFSQLRSYRQAFLMLLAFLVYNDGIQTIIKMATAYGSDLGIGRDALIAAVLVVQFVGIPFAFVFGHLGARIGARRAIFLGLAVYVGISIFAYFMTTASHFFILAAVVGMVQGGTQALSRSLFASMVPPHRSGEFFGFFSVFEKFAGIFGPLLFAGALAMTGTSRAAILWVIAFFAGGAVLLSRGQVEAGRRAARAAEARARPVDPLLPPPEPVPTSGGA
jgi:UMF1 family MFS transporter